MRLNKELEERVNQKIKETIDKINAHYKIGMKMPIVYYDVTGTTSGIAKYPSLTLHLNPKLLLQNVEDTIKNTIPHEVCHLGVMNKSILEGRSQFPKAHGAEWKLMMWIVGATANRCHNYDVKEIKKPVPEYEYKCLCSEPLIVGQALHNKLKTKKYICAVCNEKLLNGTRILKVGFESPSPNGTTKVREE